MVGKQHWKFIYENHTQITILLFTHSWAMADEALSRAGLHFDELNKIRVLEPEIQQQTSELKEECKEFVDSKYTFLLSSDSLFFLPGPNIVICFRDETNFGLFIHVIFSGTRGRSTSFRREIVVKKRDFFSTRDFHGFCLCKLQITMLVHLLW